MSESNQRLHLVFGGELKHVGSTEFSDPSKAARGRLFADAAEARTAWSAAARATIDDAQMRYFVVEISDKLGPHP